MLCVLLLGLKALTMLRATQYTVSGRVQGVGFRAFVADAAGEGTTLVAALSPADFTPSFGPGSREAHLADGAHEVVEVDVPTLRRDVDTPADLREAIELGVGSRTVSVATGLRL